MTFAEAAAAQAQLDLVAAQQAAVNAAVAAAAGRSTLLVKQRRCPRMA